MPLMGREEGHAPSGGGGWNKGGEDEFPCPFCGEPIKRLPAHLPCDEAPTDLAV